MIAGSERMPESAAPAAIATSVQRLPSRLWTASRRMSARPAKSTADGDMMPGQTGMRQGLSGGQTVPTFITTQLPAGMVRMKRMRLMRPTVRPDMLKGILRVSRGYRSESRRLPKRRN